MDRRFDADRTLDRALAYFRRRGFSAATYDDLVAETGVARHGLYQAFGDKRALYRAALARYRERVAREVIAPLRADDASLPAVERLLADLAASYRDEPEMLGCFAGNTIGELGDRESAIADEVRAYLADLRDALAHALRRAVERGEVGRHVDPDRYADLIAGAIQGAAVFDRAGAPVERVDNLFQAALDALRPAPVPA